MVGYGFRQRRQADDPRQHEHDRWGPFPSSIGGATIATPRGVLVAGDLIDGDTTDTTAITNEWNYWTRDFGLTGSDGAVLHLPVYETWGNRDADTIVQAGIVARNQSRLGSPNISPASAGQSGVNYSWDWDNLHLVTAGLYPANANLSLQRPDAAYDPQQSLSFLVSDLARNVGDSGRPVVIMFHIDLPTPADDTWWLTSQQTDFLNAVKDYNVVAVVDGHHSSGQSTWNGITVLDGDQMIDGYWVVQIDGTQFTAARTTRRRFLGRHLRQDDPHGEHRRGLEPRRRRQLGTSQPPGAAGFVPQFLGDTATFGPAIGGTPATVTLDGDCLASGLTFNNTAAGYTIAAGSGGSCGCGPPVRRCP